MEESSEHEFHNNPDHQNSQNDTASQQSQKTLEEFAKPQTAPMIGDGVVPGENREEEEEEEEEEEDEEEGEGEGEDREYQNALDEEIRQVIYKESLNEAVMNLALEEEQRNGHGWDGGSSNFGGFGMGELGFGRGLNGDGWEGSDGERGRSGNVSDMQGQYVNDWVAAEEQGEEDQEGNDGIEESSGFGGSNNYIKRQFQYPLRIDAEDCPFYMKTGNCKFGMNCKFNHPQKRRTQVARDRLKPRAEDSERSAQTECKYYLTPGGCKFGSACKYNHSREKSALSPAVEFNFLGLPIRLGEKECPYYMRNGSCKYGSNCKFNHPDPTSAAVNDPASSYGNVGPIKLHGAIQSADLSWSSPSVMLPQSPGVPSNPDWNGYQTMGYSTSEGSLPTPPAFAMNNPVIEANLYAHHQQQMPVDEFPERPGEPDCSYFLRTGDCKYKATCRYHHPKRQNSKPTPCALSEKGLPLRPDQSICSFYNRYGICKFGPACKFDHPENWGKSLSSDGSGMRRSEMEAGFS